MQDLVRGASSGDAFVFFCGLLRLFPLVYLTISFLDAGHSGQQPVTTDLNEIDGLDECLSDLYSYFNSSQNLTLYMDIDIVTCDYKKILDNVSLAWVIRRLFDAEHL